MANGRNNKLTGQIGEFLVCAELGKRGLIATPFAGNVPAFDVLAADELCRTVPIQVKASSPMKEWELNSWPALATDWMDIELDEATGRQHLHGPKVITNPDLIYVCVALAPVDTIKRDRFFVLRKCDIQDAIIEGYSLWMDERNWTRPRNVKRMDSRYFLPSIEKFENNWNLITEQLQAVNPAASLESTDE